MLHTATCLYVSLMCRSLSARNQIRGAVQTVLHFLSLHKDIFAAHRHFDRSAIRHLPDKTSLGPVREPGEDH
jgi:hypothetical protein